MAVNETLNRRIREVLAGVPRVEEKHMFRGVAFLVNGKLCVSAGDHSIMCRVDPDTHDQLTRQPGCRTVVMKGRPYLGYVYVDEEVLATKRQLRAWIDRALAYNPRARSSKKPARPRRDGSEIGKKKGKAG